MRTSRYTYRQLADLAAATPTCPLRVIAHIDLDAYYAQCEMRRLGTADETPLVVQQWRNIIAVNYPARAFGISRMISAAEAKRLCPDLVVQHVPTWKEGETRWAYHEDAYSAMAQHKVSLEPYRIRSREILSAIKESLPGTGAQACKIEKAGIDEVFVDLSAYVHELLVNRLYPNVLADYREHHYDQPTALLPLPPLTEADLDWAATGSDIIDDKEGGTGRKRTEGGEEGEDENRSTHEDNREEENEIGDNRDNGGNERVIDWDDVAMLEGARIVRAVRQALYDKLQFRCSAGIASNKMLSKLGSSQHKPDKQTVVRPRAVAVFLEGLSSVTKLRGLGGKMGARVVAAFDTESIAELRTVSLAQMQAKLDDQEAGFHIHGMVRGIDTNEVTARTEIKSIISAKSFQPPLKSIDQALRWLRVFAAELKCRLLDEKLSLALLAAATVSAGDDSGPDDRGAQTDSDELQATTHTTAHQQHFQRLRLPQTIRLHYGGGSNGYHWRSRQTRIPRDGTPLDEDKLLKLGTQLLEQTERADVLWPCAHLAISVDGFEEPVKNNKSIESFFQKAAAPSSTKTSTTSATSKTAEERGGRDENDDDFAASLREAGDDGDNSYDNNNNMYNSHDMPLTKRRRTEREVADTATTPLSKEEGHTKTTKQGGAERARAVDERPRATSGSSRRTTAADAGASVSSGASGVSTFFKPKSDDVSRIGHGNAEDNDGSDANANSGPFACGRCSKSFPAAIQLQEHEDWHVARALQAQEKPPSTAASTTASASTTTIRRRGHVPVKRAAPTPPANPISSFFQNRAKSPTKKEDSNGNSGTTAAAATAPATGLGPGPLTCQRCGAAFDHPDGLQVHQDWHFAKDLETG